MPLMQTLLPLPVAPATSRCGIAARSPMMVLPYTSLPSAIGSFALPFWKTSSSSSSRIGTITLSRLANSIPTVSLPGIGARILIRSALVARAKSASKLAIRLTRKPSAGRTSYRVIDGPRVMSPGSTVMPKLDSVRTIVLWIASNSPLSAGFTSSSGQFNKSNSGNS